MNRKISMSQLKRLVKESENCNWEECVNAISNAVENGEMTWEEVAREALLYMTEDNIIEMAYANKWDLDLSGDVTLDEDERLEETRWDDDENEYIVEPDPNGGLDLNGNPKMIKRARGFGDDLNDLKKKVKGWFTNKR